MDICNMMTTHYGCKSDHFFSIPERGSHVGVNRDLACDVFFNNTRLLFLAVYQTQAAKRPTVGMSVKYASDCEL